MVMVVVVSGLTLIVSSIFGQDLNKVQTWWSFFWREREGETKKKKIKRPFQIPKDDEKKKTPNQLNNKTTSREAFWKVVFDERWFDSGDKSKSLLAWNCSKKKLWKMSALAVSKPFFFDTDCLISKWVEQLT